MRYLSFFQEHVDTYRIKQSYGMTWCLDSIDNTKGFQNGHKDAHSPCRELWGMVRRCIHHRNTDFKSGYIDGYHLGWDDLERRKLKSLSSTIAIIYRQIFWIVVNQTPLLLYEISLLTIRWAFAICPF